MIRLWLLFTLTITPSMSVVAQRTASPQKTAPTVSNIKDPSVVDGCGCYFRFPFEWNKRSRSDKYLFMGGIDEDPWMNIDGKDMQLTLIGESKSTNTSIGSRSNERYRTNGVNVRVDYIVTRVCRSDDENCESTEYDVTFTVTKGGLNRVIKAKGVCGC